jgi:deferrochelatase/peroxidase EfeB
MPEQPSLPPTPGDGAGTSAKTGSNTGSDTAAEAGPGAGAPRPPGRRRLLGAVAAGGAGLLAGGAGGFGIDRALGSSPDAPAAAVPFYGARQAGIATAQQGRLVFASFDVTTPDVRALRAVLGQWTAAAARMTAGHGVGAPATQPQSPPDDTGEAKDLPPSRLTVTVGFGASLFDDRFGLAHKRPDALRPLPALPGDGDLKEKWSGGDLCVQACADDPQVAYHAVRNLARLGRGTVTMRWAQVGFGRTSSTSSAQRTPRNLMGFKDGTNNLKAEDTDLMDRWVWVGDESDQHWMRNGSYLVARRIRMMIETWDADSLADQEKVFGRHKDSGAPLGGKREFDRVDLKKKGPHGGPLIDAGAHIRLASPSSNGGVRLLRRAYSYTDGLDPQTGSLDAGLFMIVFNRDPHRQFAVVQSKLGQSDNLNEYIKHVGSAVFAVPPGVREAGDWYGRSLFG